VTADPAADTARGAGTAHLRDGDALLRVEHLVVEFPAGTGHTVHAVSDVSFDVFEGETLGLVGESGCGKSTTGRTIVQLTRPTSGSVMFDGGDLATMKGEALRRVRPRLQMIFQDPISSLNPRRRVKDIVAEPLAIWGSGNNSDRQLKVREVLDAVGLDYDTAGRRRPHEFSGGQCQRISIARAILRDAPVLVLDEPTAGLDAAGTRRVMTPLTRLMAGRTTILITHDLALAAQADDVLTLPGQQAALATSPQGG
jgi:peptide/nickel transport system ATP-binding protein